MEKGQYATALDLSQKAMIICDQAIRTGDHPGYSTWFVRDMPTYLYNVQASAELEMASLHRALALHLKIRDIRKANKRPGNRDDEMWIGAADGNVAASFLVENRADEALPILQELLERDDLKANRDTYLMNMSLCLRLLNRLGEALQFCKRAMDAVTELQGEQSLAMAL